MKKIWSWQMSNESLKNASLLWEPSLDPILFLPATLVKPTLQSFYLTSYCSFNTFDYSLLEMFLCPVMTPSLSSSHFSGNCFNLFFRHLRSNQRLNKDHISDNSVGGPLQFSIYTLPLRKVSFTRLDLSPAQMYLSS